MADVCSGEFPNIQSGTENQENEKSKDSVPNENTELPRYDYSEIDQFPSTNPSSQDLLDICSGKFTGTDEGISEKGSTNEKNVHISPTDELIKRKSSDLEHDVIISQLLDEEEMENFKKKFDTPVQSNLSREMSEGVEESRATGVIDSDNDEDGDEIQLKRKKNKSKLRFSGIIF